MTEVETMLLAWHRYLATGSTIARDVALQLADDNRRRAREGK